MTNSNDLSSEISQILNETWDITKTTLIPEPEDIRLSNHAKDLENVTVLYADIDESTNMVQNYKWWFSAEVYKCYLKCAARIIKDEGGAITAYDGDRIMGIFNGNNKNNNAVRAAMKISYAVDKIINPAIKKRYNNTEFTLKHQIGIDTSQIFAARTGVRGSNDIVWIGRAANFAAKLTSLSNKPILITASVYENIQDNLKINSNGTNAWIHFVWTEMNIGIYGSSSFVSF